MKVYFTCSTAKFSKYRETYFQIREHLILNGHVLTRDWLPHTDELLKRKRKDLRNIRDIYKACIKAIRDAEVVIIEDTVSNFSTGHQISLALQLKKPVLVLWQGSKHREFSKMFIHGVDSNILDIHEYAESDLMKNIDKFIKKYEGSSEKSRFHLVLQQNERAYLDWAQFHYGKSRTELIRGSLMKSIGRDSKYQSYLEGKNSGQVD